MDKKQYKKATSGDVVKLVNKGDSVSGVYLGYEESKQYTGTYAVKVKNPASESATVVFVSGIVIDLIKTNNIIPGMDIMIEFKGMGQNKIGQEYKTYDVYYA